VAKKNGIFFKALGVNSEKIAKQKRNHKIGEKNNPLELEGKKKEKKNNRHTYYSLLSLG
jgi:hypothetical protein